MCGAVNPQDFVPGLYRHFKGDLYRAFFLAQHEYTLEHVVVYMHLADGAIWTRSLGHWNEHVEWPDGTIRSRFVKELSAPSH
jgi:hypothetical protein